MKKYKVLGFLPIHYGIDFLKECLLSVKDEVDMMVVAYSKNPSHGYEIAELCPDSEEHIHAICKDVLGDKLIWDRAESYPSENHHRDVKHKYAAGYDVVLSIDADEVYKTDEIAPAIDLFMQSGTEYGGIKGYINFWRNFEWICTDGFRPIRLHNLTNRNGIQNIEVPLTVYHFSTCQREELMRYKFKVFGHASEVRKGWLDQIYYGWHPIKNNFGDVHVVAFNLWNPAPFDKNSLPQILKDHKYFNKEVV